jgi:hypothetical protein
MDPVNIPPMLAYIAYMDPVGIGSYFKQNIFSNLGVRKEIRK